ncbi:uncharacterized protein LOC116971600 [Amblyraja radiata]|uniref:uncharacterized protein LOC116971600 n=1 Tax=Amblyraja radiata TaxID=386614 RepID=UPI001401DCDC|nr:uncharacterized protein LOC116971600 [Amblyraja radiata]
MVGSQAQFATHSGQEITQSNSFQIQSKSASTTVNEIVIKPASVGFQNPVCKNDKTAIVCRQNLGTAESVKRKTESTHQAQSDAQPNKKTQSTGTKRNVNKNQPKHIDVEQPQGKPVTRDMVESQAQFATHSVNEAVTKPDGSNVSLQDPVVIGNTTVPQTSQRLSTRSRNSISRFTEDNSAAFKQCHSVLPISHAEGSNIERLVCKNDKMATMSSHVLDISASLKRKTESTHQAKSGAQPKKKTQSTGTKRNINKNQPKNIDVEQPQRRPKTLDMVESQAQFATHSGQEITQSNSFEIQSKSASTTANEIVTKPASVGFQNPVVIGNTTVPQTSLRRSGRTRNSFSGFTGQAEDNSARSKQCQRVLSISHPEGSNIERLVCKNDKTAIVSRQNLGTAESVKRKTESTHQAQSDAQPNKKTRSTGTKRNVNKNQPKHIDVEQPQRRPKTLDMVELQAQFATHSGQEITQSNSFEIQSKSASTTVNEIVTKPASVGFQNPVVIGNTTVPQTSLKQSGRTRNSFSGFTVQAEDNSARSKQCQSVLPTSHPEGSNIEGLVCKNDKTAIVSRQNLGRAESVKRKAESTHQAKSDAQPNKKTQSTGTKRNVNKNQPKHIDVEQPQGKPVTRDMVESQAQFATHSVNEAVTKPAGSNVSLQDPVVIGNTTVPQTSQRLSTRSRNSISRFTEENSAPFKQCQSVLPISHAEGSNIERLVCKNDKMATRSGHVLDISASLKRKTESTHQSKSDAQPNKKTQSTGTKRNINKNQPKHIDVAQPQGKPVTHDIVESQAQFATHSGQEITQSDFFEIQTKFASTTVNEAVTKPAGSNVSFQDPVVISNTTVPQTSLRGSTRSRNSSCGFTVQDEDNSATSKLCQIVLSLSNAEGSNIERLVRNIYPSATKPTYCR